MELDNDYIEAIKNEIVWKYGSLPESVENLFKITIIKNKCKKFNIQKLSLNNGNIFVSFYKNNFAGSEKLLKYCFSRDSLIKLKQNEIEYICNNNIDIFENTEELIKLLDSFCNNF